MKIEILSEIKITALLTGILSYVPYIVFLGRKIRKIFGKGQKKRDLDYGFNVLKSRIEDAKPIEINLQKKTFLEIAPGDNFSGPISACLMGATKSIGIDAFDYTDLSLNQQILEVLVECIRVDDDDYQKLSGDLKKFEKDRISEYFSYFAPYSRNNIADQSVDIAMSLSTMEHVKSPEELYRILYYWLAPNALLINKIDFSSHGMTRRWYGHYLLPISIWKIIQGKKVNYLNRWTEQSHLDCCRNLGFELVKRVPYETFENAPAILNNLPFAALHVWKKPLCNHYSV